jgi:hypothetical protein
MRYALPAVGAALLIGSAALAGPDNVAFPEGYPDSFVHYSTVNRADERKQVVKIFANDVALASAKDGAPLDSGSVLVMEIYKAQVDYSGNPVKGADGFFIPAEMAAITVMESRAGWGDEYPEEWRNSTWEFAAFKSDDHSLVERDYQPCFECHKPLHEADYVFSFDALSKAAGN